MNKLTVGFIGLGLMGNPMAKNILKKGFPLSVYNRSAKRLEEFKKLHVAIANSPKELANSVDVLITMITGPKDVEEIYLGKDGVGETKNKNLIAIDMSTIGPTAIKNIAQKLSFQLLDAPVTGSTYKAKTGELTIFIGGKERTYKKIKPILETMGTNLQYMGEQGSGQAIKLINNFLVAATITSLGESMLLADALALPRQKAADALKLVPALSPFMAMKLPNVVNEAFPVAFSLNNMTKDLKLAVNESKGKRLHVLKQIEILYDKAQKIGLGEEDMSAVIKVLS
ncbi:MAG: NAD(P)-dependent oxidoreductase [Candidatus Levybacteria bacterium]|nr:NAD(P)-dependent oxidoreductase [Candidatus Levybacteria bacterium]